MKRAIKSKTIFFPMPAVLVAAEHEGESGLCTVAWIGMVGGTPATIAMGLRNVRHTLGLVEASGEFTVNIPCAGMEAAVDFCGIEAGGGDEKWARAGLTPAPALSVSAPVVAECPMVLECRITSTHNAGEYRVVLAEVLEIQAEEELIRDDGNIDVELLDPLTYVPGMREYRALGRKVADAYSVGRPLKDAAR
jgi:flavin reductase (DIM6/NTAB) family NADH-FMN oxidoreductase RutF